MERIDLFYFILGILVFPIILAGILWLFGASKSEKLAHYFLIFLLVAFISSLFRKK